MEIENRKRLEELVSAIEGFINSPVHACFVGSTKRDLETLNETILDLQILSSKDAFELAHLKGQRQVFLANISLFEDTVDNLKARILAIQDAEQEIPHNPNEEEYENIG